MKRIIDFLKGLPIYVYILIAFLLVVLMITSCQGLFNVNTDDSDVEVVLSDSFNLGGTK